MKDVSTILAVVLLVCGSSRAQYGGLGGNTPLLVDILGPNPQNQNQNLNNDYDNGQDNYGSSNNRECRTDYDTVTETVYEEKVENVCNDISR